MGYEVGYEGIITGIGSVDKNQILPELDAIVNKVIFNQSGILDGLRISNNGLTKGVCLLCGYCGVLEEDIPDLVNDWEDEMGGTDDYSEDFYVYGKFTINFDTNTVDSFDIVTTNILHSEPSQITGSGVYYLHLYSYTSGSWDDDSEIIQYPLRSEYAETTTVLSSNGVIGANATGTTQTVNDNSTKPATTEYVHNQIAEEIAYDTTSGNFVDANNNTIGTYFLKRKSNYVVGQLTATTVWAGVLTNVVVATFPVGFRPINAISFLIGGATARQVNCDTNGNCVPTDNYYTAPTGTIYIGYETY